MAENKGQPVLGHHEPSTPACLGSKDRGSNLLILPKQAEGRGPWCTKTGCPLILAMRSL